MSIEETLMQVRYNVDKEPHITLDKEKCRHCATTPCLYCCPADCFKIEGNELTFNWPACLECGSCRIVCHDLGNGAVNWTYPRGGFGVCYRLG